MTKTETALNKVDENKVYSLTEIVRKGLIPFIKSYQTANKEVLMDIARPKKERLLNANIIGEGRARTIRISGQDLIKYLEANKDKLEK